MTDLHGSWIWYELITPDTAAAGAFYEAVVGWHITPGTEPPLFYGFIGNADGGATGGILPLSAEMAANGATPRWLGYIGVDDCDAALAAITAAGGKVCMTATDIPGAGRIGMAADCCGALFYVMTPSIPAGAGPSTAFSPTLPGRCAWNELHAGNQQGAIAFYTGLFGWSLPAPMDMGPYGTYQFIDHAGVTMGGILRQAPYTPVPGWKHYFRVPSIDAAAAAVTRNGGTVTQEPHQVPGGDWIILGRDPQGAEFALVGARGD